MPRSVPRVIVLDTDLFVFASLRGLWDLFGRFETPQLIGLAQARPPHTRPPMPPQQRPKACVATEPKFPCAGQGRANQPHS